MNEDTPRRLAAVNNLSAASGRSTEVSYRIQASKLSWEYVRHNLEQH